MSIRTLLFTPRFDPAYALWKNALPSEIRLEAESTGPGRLDAEMLYPRTRSVGITVQMQRWSLEHDLRNGRILRLTFPEARPGPKLPYDELVEALKTVNAAYADPHHGTEPYRFGLAIGSKLLLEWLRDDETILRAALTPPFPDASA